MTRSDDPGNEMARLLSVEDADRLLRGEAAPGDLPRDAAPLAQLLAGVRAAVPAGDPFTEQRRVSEIAARIRLGALTDDATVVPFRRRRRISAKAGGLAFVAVLAGSTAAAAATGSLPDGIQRAVSDALSHVSISVPHPDAHPKGQVGSGQSPAAHDGLPPAQATGPDAGGSAQGGLCTAANAHGAQTHSVAFSNLEKAAAAAGVSVDEFCKDAGPGNTTHTTPTTPNPGDGNTTHTTPTTPNRGDGNTTHTTPTTPNRGNGNTTPTTNPNKGQGNSSAGGNGSGSADSHASQEASGTSTSESVNARP